MRKAFTSTHELFIMEMRILGFSKASGVFGIGREILVSLLVSASLCHKSIRFYQNRSQIYKLSL